MTRRPGGARDWRTLLNQTMRKHRLAYGVERARALMVWPEVVGTELARMTRARSVQRGVLFVEARDAVLANFLTMQREMFLTKLQDKMGDESITEIRFSVGTMRVAVQPRPSEPLPPADRERAEQMVQGLPDGLRETALKAAESVERARLWRERQGWAPCAVCGTPSRHSPCVSCRSLLDTPSVQAAARAMARTPEELATVTARLGESAADAARFVALETLTQQLDELAVECARSGGAEEYLDFLRTQADVWLSLKLRKPRSALSRVDWNELPDRARRVLTGG